MGQYFKAIVKRENNQIDVYNRDLIINGKTEYTLAKLMEHSWWFNPFVNGVCFDLYDSRLSNRVAWVGDYAQDFLQYKQLTEFNGLKKSQINAIYNRCWNVDGRAVPMSDFSLAARFLNNRSKNEYIDCSKYYDNCVTSDGWCLHPLPLLTCIGNGLGGGDYTHPTEDSTMQYVGAWVWDKISITDKALTGFSEITPIFKEKC